MASSTTEIMDSYSSNILENDSGDAVARSEPRFDSDSVARDYADVSKFDCPSNDQRHVGENIVINNLKYSFGTSTPILSNNGEQVSNDNNHDNSSFDAYTSKRSSSLNSVNSSDSNFENSTNYDETENLLNSFLNKDVDLNISEDHRKLLIFILGKID